VNRARGYDGFVPVVPIAYALPYQQIDIGAYRGTCEQRFNGDIDEVRIFDRALGAAEIGSISSTPYPDGTGAGLQQERSPAMTASMGPRAMSALRAHARRG